MRYEVTGDPLYKVNWVINNLNYGTRQSLIYFYCICLCWITICSFLPLPSPFLFWLLVWCCTPVQLAFSPFLLRHFDPSLFCLSFCHFRGDTVLLRFYLMLKIWLWIFLKRFVMFIQKFLCQAIGTYFMDVVNSSHIYATGGTSESEFWY